MAQELKITLDLYEGPLDLLLDLIRRQKLDIYDIPIADVTAQYLDYLHLMQDMDVDVASEFLLIAAQLIYIKSRMLLPLDPDASPEDGLGAQFGQLRIEMTRLLAQDFLGLLTVLDRRLQLCQPLFTLFPGFGHGRRGHDGDQSHYGREPL